MSRWHPLADHNLSYILVINPGSQGANLSFHVHWFFRGFMVQDVKTKLKWIHYLYNPVLHLVCNFSWDVKISQEKTRPVQGFFGICASSESWKISIRFTAKVGGCLFNRLLWPLIYIPYHVNLFFTKWKDLMLSYYRASRYIPYHVNLLCFKLVAHGFWPFVNRKKKSFIVMYF